MKAAVEACLHRTAAGGNRPFAFLRHVNAGLREAQLCRESEKKNEDFNSLPTSVYLEKKPLCHWVILTTCARASVSPTMTAF